MLTPVRCVKIWNVAPPISNGCSPAPLWHRRQPLPTATRRFSSATAMHISKSLGKHIQWRSLRRCPLEVKSASYPFQEVSGFLREVGWKAELALQDFVDGLFAVFASEWRLGAERWGKKRIAPSPQDSYDIRIWNGRHIL